MTKSNAFISALGLPGCGKTTVMREVARILGTDYYFPEPEEKYWGEAVKDREIVGYFTGLMWFRSNRIPNLIKARKLYEQGNNVVVDSYYDKAVKSYLGKKGMEWLIDDQDDYFDVSSEIAALDWYRLPNVTHLVTFELTKEVWLRNLNIRNRNLDNNKDLLKSFGTQRYFIEAAAQLSEEFGIQHINIEVKDMSVTETAEKIAEMIESKELIYHGGIQTV
ncbi:hypothetical protein [Bacillus tropicus]|uniref:hypothetical protein n=1 Tax=Bacillus tropicus TaxID=2026188 RepID=UPI002DB7EC18|nr:hypothetical protein [Bacillus tropicus]MEC2921289.1 hypothetical protein [Bacillus tropicus]MEC2926683.1 hypothetical protein [Bacillus tropicus]MEC2956088.1 hypothetical protein [Bacillus tropicus]MEC3051290.1 hypothetical protein [Bacillus tropicus]MEC3077420.1 hypothetical protein [Bacillus tropicus]